MTKTYLIIVALLFTTPALAVKNCEDTGSNTETIQCEKVMLKRSKKELDEAYSQKLAEARTVDTQNVIHGVYAKNMFASNAGEFEHLQNAWVSFTPTECMAQVPEDAKDDVAQVKFLKCQIDMSNDRIAEIQNTKFAPVK